MFDLEDNGRVNVSLLICTFKKVFPVGTFYNRFLFYFALPCVFYFSELIFGFLAQDVREEEIPAIFAKLDEEKDSADTVGYDSFVKFASSDPQYVAMFSHQMFGSPPNSPHGTASKKTH